MDITSYITDHVKKIWYAWNLRGAILLSLSLQAFLILFAPSRKRASKAVVVMLIWITYLLADWAASFSIGLISKSQVNRPGPDHNGDLLAFWAPFLLLHLGGPDTITSFSLEDNELWLRHLLGLIFQAIAVAYVFYQSLPNKLWMPIGLVFLSGMIKYGERTRALYLASISRFSYSMRTKPDPGPNYAKLMEEYSSKKEANLPAKIDMMPEPDKESRTLGTADSTDMDDIEVVWEACRFFKIFKGLFVDIIFSFRERNESREFFHRRNPEDILRLLEVELNFFYDVLYTKIVVVGDKFGYFCRFICFSSVEIALALFFFMDKAGFEIFNVAVTYTLLLGAIALEVVALLQLIFSDWTVSALKNHKKYRVLAPIFRNYLSLKKSTWYDDEEEAEIGLLAWLKRHLFRRWSKSISTYNLIDYSILERRQEIQNFCDRVGHSFSKIIVLMGLKEFLDHMRYSSKIPFTKELWSFIHRELREKSVLANDLEYAKIIYSARGDWVLHDLHWSKLLPSVNEVEYDESLILWHVATDLLYSTTTNTEESNDCHRRFSKVLSDYMLYLLVVQSKMMSSIVGIGRIRFQDTCAEAEKFLARKELPTGKEHEEASKYILKVNTTEKPVYVKGDRSKSVLFDASRLAKELMKFEDQKWMIISKVWVELLSYAASHCRATAHAHQLSKGGELVTFVWLLMAHFGLGEQFQINEGQARAKLIVKK
ncbi:C1_2 domain-containing protein [Psidium guajava]|nr:C1_2 domain-containing protein [Psidium guajava]